MVGFDHPHHPLRMTDGGLGSTVRKKEKKQIYTPNGGVRRVKVVVPSHHKDHTTVHGRVESEDSKESTWISKDAG
jgi:hypothetical protein